MKPLGVIAGHSRPVWEGCTNRADQADHFRAGNSEGVSASRQGASGVVRDR
jgi:hypothetical protein